MAIPMLMSARLTLSHDTALSRGSGPRTRSGARQRMRLHRGGNRQLNSAFHRIVVTQIRMHPPARDYIARRIAEVKTKREAIRCLKRHLIRTIYNAMTPTPDQTPAPALALT